MSDAHGIRREFAVRFTSVEHGRRTTAPPPPPRVGHVPRVARLLALAHHFDHLIEQGIVEDYAEIARLAQLSRARVAQIMTLKFLAPDIQERIAMIPQSYGKDRITEKRLRRIAMTADWHDQVQQYEKLSIVKE